MRLFLKITFLLVGAIFSFSASQAQDSSHVTWLVHAKKIEPGKYDLRFSGNIQQGWHLYAKANATAELFGLLIRYPDSTIQQQNFELSGAVKQIADPIFENKNMEVVSDEINITQQLQFTNEVPASLKLQLNYDVGDEGNFLPEEQFITVTLDSTVAPVPATRLLVNTIDLHNPINNCGQAVPLASSPASNGLLNLFFLGFVGGLIALLTPCVFPMIPLTVSFFTKKSATKRAGIINASTYGFFIFLIYILLSLPFHFLDTLNPEILNNISTSVVLNIIFFAVFVFFAFSFFGFYEITLPASFSSKADSKAGAGNVAGIFFMALTLAIVSFSCTGPILGSLLAGSLSGDGGAMQLTSGMAGFGLALALPFALFALFPHWLQTLPKSGGWLTTVKVVLGFIELGLAFKFLSNADLVKHWGLLKREVFIGIWILIGIAVTLYLFGIFKIGNAGPMKKSRTRLLFAFLFGLFTLYLLPGITNSMYANLSLISGFPPPLYYSIYNQEGTKCVLGLNCTLDYAEGLKKARQENKPMLLDFTGYACVNCRRMEENVWSKPDVFKLMHDKFIVVSLYVDDKKKLPAAQQFTYTTSDSLQKEIITVGDKWATFQTENFKNNSQPLYAIINTDEKLLNNPVPYTPSPIEYLAWLQCGLDAFEKK
ncbi:MAG: cytochrome c biogenesis protein CcdA [Ferruginibacter sp.]